MESSEFKFAMGALAVFVVFVFGGIFYSDYLGHKREMACIEKGGTPANKTCLFGVKGAQ